MNECAEDLLLRVQRSCCFGQSAKVAEAALKRMDEEDLGSWRNRQKGHSVGCKLFWNVRTGESVKEEQSRLECLTPKFSAGDIKKGG